MSRSVAGRAQAAGMFASAAVCQLFDSIFRIPLLRMDDANGCYASSFAFFRRNRELAMSRSVAGRA